MPEFVYLYRGASLDDFNAEQDDPPRGLEAFEVLASPQVWVIAHQFSWAVIGQMRDEMWQEVYDTVFQDDGSGEREAILECAADMSMQVTHGAPGTEEQNPILEYWKIEFRIHPMSLEPDFLVIVQKRAVTST